MTGSTLVAHTDAAGATQDLAAALAELAVAGDVIVLAGEMGAGKTAFAQGFARGLGIEDQVTSPTFTIVQEYPGGRLGMHHLDVYRLDQLREVADLGLAEMLEEEAVMLVEWGDAVLPVLGDTYLEVRFGFGAADDERHLALRPVGARWVARHRALGDALASWLVEPEAGCPSC